MGDFSILSIIINRKGALKPVRITIKVRQGRKASTLVTGFEPFLVVGAEEMAEELRRVCASATSGALCLPLFPAFLYHIFTACISNNTYIHLILINHPIVPVLHPFTS